MVSLLYFNTRLNLMTWNATIGVNWKTVPSWFSLFAALILVCKSFGINACHFEYIFVWIYETDHPASLVDRSVCHLNVLCEKPLDIDKNKEQI
jgi:hypothetical protein